MRLIDADALIAELEKDEAKYDKLSEDAQDDPHYSEAMWSRGNGIRDAMIRIHHAIYDAVIKSYDTPTIEPKYGEWVPFEYGDERWHKCTACGVADRYIEYVERPNGTTGKLVAIRNFCPNCGARMDGKREGE